MVNNAAKSPPTTIHDPVDIVDAPLEPVAAGAAAELDAAAKLDAAVDASAEIDAGACVPLAEADVAVELSPTGGAEIGPTAFKQNASAAGRT
jgi:hypothetical protein